MAFAMTRDPTAYFAPYDPEACRVCGECLASCPVMALPPEEAQAEMTALRAGEEGRYVLSRCETCFSCTVRCAQRANPASLFQQRFFEYRSGHGLPAWSPYFQPHEPWNFREVAVRTLGAADRARIAGWMDLSPTPEFFYPGCNLTSVPWMVDEGLLSGLPVRGGMEVCCGETLFRMGMFDHLRQNAARLDTWLSRLRARRMYLLCSAGVNMFRHVLPRYGLTSRVEVVPYLPILRDRIRSGAIPVTRPAGLTVALQESCYGKVLGPDYLAVPREILAAVGARVVEMDHCRDRSYCCGIGGGFPAKVGYHPFRMIAAARRVLAEAKKTGAQAIATYCAGCWMMLSAMRVFALTTLPVYHVIELVQIAMGKEPKRRVASRMAANLGGSIVFQFPKLLSRRRVFKGPILPFPG